MVNRGNPRFTSDGVFLGFIGSCLDISDQKHHQEAIRRYNQLLEEEVNEQTRRIHELDQRRMQVEKLAALSQVAAGVAHEINNPFASIKQSFHLLKKLLPAEHPRLKYVAKVMRKSTGLPISFRKCTNSINLGIPNQSFWILVKLV